MRRRRWRRGRGSVSQFSSGLWSFIICGLGLRRTPPEKVRQPGKDSGKHVAHGDDKEHVAVKRKQQKQETADKHQGLERMPVAQVQVFETVKAPGADHKKSH